MEHAFEHSIAKSTEHPDADTNPHAPRRVADGFVIFTSPSGDHILVPNYLVPATHQAFQGYHRRADLNVRKERGGVCVVFSIFSNNPIGKETPTLADADVLSGRCRCRLIMTFILFLLLYLLSIY